MNKSEISELRRLYKPESSAISRIAGCYVDGEKNKKAIFKETLLSLDEEDVFKYLEILKKGISGSIGRNLANLEFPSASEDAGSMHEKLLKLRDSGLEDEAELEDFFDIIINNFEISGNYLIMLSCAAYDVPGKSSDGKTMDDASEEVYRYMQCIICPVELSKAGLSYNEESREFSHRIRDWVVAMPSFALLFPAFNDRQTDIHAMLLYSKNVKDLRSEMIRNVFGCTTPLPAHEQKNTFTAALEGSLGEELKLDAVRELNDNLIQMKEEMAFNKAVVEVDANDFSYLMKDTGISEERLTDFVNAYAAATKESPILLDNIVAKKTFEVKTDSVSIKVDAEKAYLVSEQTIDGKKCIVIDIDGEQLEVNGVTIS